MPTITIDKSWAEALAKDLDKLRVATGKAKTAEDRRKVGAALKIISKRLDNLLIERLLGDNTGWVDQTHDLEPVVPIKGKRDPKWQAFHDTLYWPAAHVALTLNRLAEEEYGIASAIDRDAPERYIDRIVGEFDKNRAKYFLGKSSYIRRFFDALDTALGALGQDGRIEVPIPTEAQTRIGGYDVTLVGVADSSAVREGVARFTAALDTFHRRITRIAPRMLDHLRRVRFAVDLSPKPKRRFLGTFFSVERKVVVYPANIKSELDYVHTIAHELGHVVFRALDEKAKDAWYATVEGSTEKLDVERLLALWPRDGTGKPVAMEGLFEYLRDDHPVLALQVLALKVDHSLRRMYWTSWDDLQARHQRGELNAILVPHSPITGYGHTSPEEAFCEAFGLLIAYGPRTVLPNVYVWLETVLGADVRRGTNAGLVRASRPQRASCRARR